MNQLADEAGQPDGRSQLLVHTIAGRGGVVAVADSSEHVAHEPVSAGGLAGSGGGGGGGGVGLASARVPTRSMASGPAGTRALLTPVTTAPLLTAFGAVVALCAVMYLGGSGANGASGTGTVELQVAAAYRKVEDGEDEYPALPQAAQAGRQLRLASSSSTSSSASRQFGGSSGSLQ